MLGLVDCKLIGNKYYISKDMNLECFTKQYVVYTTVLILPACILFVFVVPIALLFLIRKDSVKWQKSIVKRYQYYYIDGEFKKK